MKFQIIDNKIEFYKIDSFIAEGWDLPYYETMYKIFYRSKKSFIYSLKNGKCTYLPFTDFGPYIISKKDDSIFLFKNDDHMSKRKECTLFRYNLKSGVFEDTYDLSQHFIGVKRFEFIKIDYVNDTHLAILVENLDSSIFSIIILNIETKRSFFVEIDKDRVIDTYYKNSQFMFEGELYIPYVVKENKKQFFPSLYRKKDILKEQGILKYNNGKLRKVKDLKIDYMYNIFSDDSEKYLACIHFANREYQVNIYYHHECLLKQKYILGKKERISFKFVYGKNNDVVFAVELKNKYEIFNLVNKTVINIDLTEEQMKCSDLLSNNMILFDDEIPYDIYSNNQKRNLYEFKV